MNTNRLRLAIGISLEENTKRVKTEVAKKKFDALVSNAAAGRAFEELEHAEIEELMRVHSARAADRVPEKMALLLGIPLKTSYADALLYCTAAFIKELTPG